MAGGEEHEHLPNLCARILPFIVSSFLWFVGMALSAGTGLELMAFVTAWGV